VTEAEPSPRGRGSPLRLLFGLSDPVSRSTYAVAGFGLTAFKYAVEAMVIRGVTGIWVRPWDYLNPLLSVRFKAAEGSDWLLWAIAAWTLPFLWIGLSMTYRRTLDAGGPGPLAYLFFVPYVNYAYLLLLCLLPSSPEAEESGGPSAARSPGPAAPGPAFKSAALGVLSGVAIALGMTGLSVLVLGSYGSTLFVATPVVVGAASAYLFNRDGSRGPGATLGVACLTVLITGGFLLAFALEGLLCLLMAAPLGLAMAMMGAVIGRAVALGRLAGRRELLMALAVLPVPAAFETPRPVQEPRSVVTSIDIAAPPERVFSQVVAFSELPEPPQWFFRLGIAYPQRARIEGRGPGAVRRCEFSTGAFVEPITAWEAPRRLAFDVIEQPPALTEWSPYRRVHAPHLDGYLRSVRGEFRLEPLPGGGTRLRGTTWYHIDVFPAAYWSLWSDALIHAIHRRVLEHVKAESEAR
jgi:uncharacterized protein YndB with AHSA1/START domain/uncharacterized membrane protein YhaH (DUF805 family)